MNCTQLCYTLCALWMIRGVSKRNSLFRLSYPVIMDWYLQESCRIVVLYISIFEALYLVLFSSLEVTGLLVCFYDSTNHEFICTSTVEQPCLFVFYWSAAMFRVSLLQVGLPTVNSSRWNLLWICYNLQDVLFPLHYYMLSCGCF